MLNALLSDALKHAFGDGRCGEVALMLKAFPPKGFQERPVGRTNVWPPPFRVSRDASVQEVRVRVGPAVDGQEIFNAR